MPAFFKGFVKGCIGGFACYSAHFVLLLNMDQGSLSLLLHWHLLQFESISDDFLKPQSQGEKAAGNTMAAQKL